MTIRKRFTTLVVSSTVVLMLSCGRSSPPSPPLEVQVQGWWVTPTTGGCSCPSQPECEAGDCKGYAVLGLLQDKRYLDGMVSFSETRHTMSAMGTLASGTYRVEGTTVVISQSKIPDARFETTVTGNQLTLGHRIDVRAPDSLATALADASRDNKATWTRFPVAP
jgi:hypothetical protein